MSVNVTQGIHHLGLTVRDVDLAESFFVEQLGFEKSGGNPDYPAKFVRDSNVMLTLWQVKDQSNVNEFNRHENIGMHHFALKVSDAISLSDLHTRLEQAGIEIEFAPEPLGQSGLHHMMCYIPGGPRLELLA